MKKFQYVLTKFRIKDGQLENFKKDIAVVNSDQENFDAGLIEAGVKIDCQFIESTSSGDYFYVFKKIEDNEDLKRIIANSKSPIYEKVRNILKNYLDDRVDLEAFKAVEM